jgi:hypothetical protein
LIVVLTASTAIANSCRKAGAKHAGLSNIVKDISKGWTSFNTVICEEESKSELSKVQSVLKPLGFMPSYENGNIVLRSKLVARVKEIINAYEPAPGPDPQPEPDPTVKPSSEVAGELSKIMRDINAQGGGKLLNLLSAIELKK